MSDVVECGLAAAACSFLSGDPGRAPVESVSAEAREGFPLPAAAEPTAPVPAGSEPMVPNAMSLAVLLERARAAQTQLSAQPLPIANRDMLLIQKLFGG